MKEELKKRLKNRDKRGQEHGKGEMGLATGNRVDHGSNHKAVPPN